MTSTKFNLYTIAKRKCECGNLMTFLRPYPAVCSICGRLVYPTKRMEFKEKLKKEIKK